MEHRNNFDFLRLLFASLVIVTHAVILSGYGDHDFLDLWTGGQTNCSYLGVRGFFVISGFLVFKSLRKSGSPWQYAKKRLLRIFPGLIAMLLVVAFLAGPMLSSLPAHTYYGDSGILRYVASSLRLPGIPKTDILPGVFSRNPAGPTVNGSLWTIWFELLFYAGLLALYPLRRREGLLRLLLPAAWAALFILFLACQAWKDDFIIPFTGLSVEVLVDLGLYFIGGSVLTMLPWSSVRLRNALIMTGLLLAILSLYFHLFHWVRYISLPLLVLGAGTAHVPLLSRLRRLGEPSYGIYIYAFPVEQAVVQLLHPSPAIVMLIALPCSFALGYASWHLVEKQFLSFKNTIR